MIQRDFYECSTLDDAQDLVSYILSVANKIGEATAWSNIIEYDDGINPIVYYVKAHSAYPVNLSKYSSPSGNKILTVKLNTRSGSEEGSGTSFTHYGAFDERVGINKQNNPNRP